MTSSITRFAFFYRRMEVGTERLMMLLIFFLIGCFSVHAQVNLSRGMCNFDPCVKEPVAAVCQVDVAVVGVVQCVCPAGFGGDGKSSSNGGSGCYNINECSIGTHTCDINSQTCLDKDPSKDNGEKFSCSCLSGFIKAPNGKGCEDVDECRQNSLNICDAETSFCRNLPGGYECICQDQTRLFDSNTGACRDVNECSDFNGVKNPCDSQSTVCVDRRGGVECHCLPGFQEMPGDNRKCADINECALQLDSCPKAISTCKNIVGDYACLCNEESGYTTNPDNPKQCTNLDECERFPMICGGSTPCCADLLPELGGYSCAPFVSASVDSAQLDPFPQQRLPYQQLPYHQQAPHSQPLPYQRDGQYQTIQSIHMGTYPSNAPISPYGQPLPPRYTSVGPRRSLSDCTLSTDGCNSMLRNRRMASGDAEVDFADYDDLSLQRVAPFRSTQMVPGGRPLLGPISASQPGLMRRQDSQVCPAGYRNVDDIVRSQARAKTMEAFRTTFAGANRANPDQVTNGIVTNAGILANEFASWYGNLASLPGQVAHASRNATNINPAGDAYMAVRAGESMVTPFVPGAGPIQSISSASGMAAHNTLGPVGQSMISNPAVAGTGGLLIGGAAVAVATAGGPSESLVLDRSGMSRLIAYDQI